MADNNNGINSVMESLLKGANALMSTKTVVGEATKIDDTIIVPLVDVSFGVGAGSALRPSQHHQKRTDKAGEYQEPGQRNQDS